MVYTDILFNAGDDNIYFITMFFQKLHQFANDIKYGMYFPFFQENENLNELHKKQDHIKFAKMGNMLRIITESQEDVEKLFENINISELISKHIVSKRDTLPVPLTSTKVSAYRWRPSYIENKNLYGLALEECKKIYYQQAHKIGYFNCRSNSSNKNFIFFFKQETSAEVGHSLSLKNMSSYGMGSTSNKVWLPFF